MNKDIIKYNLTNSRNENDKVDVSYLEKDKVEKIYNFHKTFKEYSVTPLHKLENLAKHIGVKNIYVKDESYRFGLNAFKVLGGSYAIGKYLAGKLEKDISEISFDYLNSKEVKEKIKDITFVTATDGNHGRGVAWAANKLGQKCVVYMPKGSSEIRLENIRKEGAKAEIIDGNYDDAVRLSEKMAKENGWVVIQDTAWDGYEDIPLWIMQGYTTLIYEVFNEIDQMPTHVFLQAGVGSFAGSIQGYLAANYKENRPFTAIVEPDKANCLYKSSLSGKREIVGGDMDTIMAGLACGEPNTISYEILKDYSDGYFSCPDYVSAKGMRVLASPINGDKKVVSGESGAVGIGLITLISKRDEYKDLKEEINLDENSVVLIISTEGDTDPDKYEEIVWDGLYQSI